MDLRGHKMSASVAALGDALTISLIRAVRPFNPANSILQGRLWLPIPLR